MSNQPNNPKFNQSLEDRIKNDFFLIIARAVSAGFMVGMGVPTALLIMTNQDVIANSELKTLKQKAQCFDVLMF